MSCINYPQQVEPCCLPYVPTMEDAIRACVYDEMMKLVDLKRESWCAQVSMGMKGGKATTAYMADLNSLADLVMRIWQHRQSDANADPDGNDRGLAYYWTTYKLSMSMRYFKCVHNISIDPLLLQAGLKEPTRQWTGVTLPVPTTNCTLTVVDPYVPPPDPPENCVADFNADVSVDAFEQDVSLSTLGFRSFILMDSFVAGNEWADHVQEIAVGAGSNTWTYEVVPMGSIVFVDNDAYGSSDGLYYTHAGGAVQYHPVLSANIDIDQLEITSASASAHSILNRTIRIDTSVDGINWVELYSGPEDVLDPDYTETVPLGTRHVRVYYGGRCPSYAEVNTSVEEYLPRSLRLNGNVIGQASPYANPILSETFSVGGWLKLDGVNWGNSNNQFVMLLGTLLGVDSDNNDDYRMRVSLVRINANSGEYYLECICDNLTTVTNVYTRFWKIKQPVTGTLMSALLTGDWQTLVLEKNGPVFSLEYQHFQVYLDEQPMDLSESILSIGVQADIPDTVEWSNAVNNYLNYDYSPGIGSSGSPQYALWKNVFACTAALTPQQIRDIVVPGLWEVNAVAIGLKALHNFNKPDELGNVSPYIGDKFPSLFPLLPLNGNDFVGGATGQVTVGASVFDTDIPSQLVVQ